MYNKINSKNISKHKINIKKESNWEKILNLIKSN